MRLAALVVLLPIAAFAQTSTPEPASPAPPAAVAPVASVPRAPSWSIGGGVAGTVVYVMSSGPGALGIQSAQPVAAASLERRVSGDTWLVLGLAVTYHRFNSDRGPALPSSQTNEFVSGRASAGVRRVVSPERAPVDVSFVALATASGGWVKSDTGIGGLTGSGEARGWSVGAEGGIAIDRALTGGLSLRVATPLLIAAYGRTTVSPGAGAPDEDSSDLTFSAVIAPRLELRLAF